MDSTNKHARSSSISLLHALDMATILTGPSQYEGSGQRMVPGLERHTGRG